MYRPILLGPAPHQDEARSPAESTLSPASAPAKVPAKRGRITTVACTPCKKRKSKCNGIRPSCSTCQSKGTKCTYDMSEDERWQGTLRVNLKNAQDEVRQLRSLMPVIATSSRRDVAASLAMEIEQIGLQGRSVEDIRKLLADDSHNISKEGFAGANTSQGQWKPDFEHYPMQVSYPEGFSYPATHIDGEHSSKDSNGEASDGGDYGGQQLLSYRFHDASFPGNGAMQSESSAASEAASVTCQMGFSELYVPDGKRHGSQGANNVQWNGWMGPISYLVSAYVAFKQRLISQGCHPEEVLGPLDDDLNPMLFQHRPPENTQTVSTFAANVTCNFLQNAATPLAEKLACAWLVRAFLRWQICPNNPILAPLPDFLRPTRSQRFVAHDPLINFMPWPEIREFLILNPREFEQFQDTSYVRVNWPYQDAEMFYWSAELGRHRMTPEFLAHIQNIRSWTLDGTFIDKHPTLIGKIPASPSPHR